MTGDIERIDPKTGAVVWKGITPPSDGGGVTYFGAPFVLGPPGVLLGSSFGGVVVAATDP